MGQKPQEQETSILERIESFVSSNYKIMNLTDPFDEATAKEFGMIQEIPHLVYGVGLHYKYYGNPSSVEDISSLEVDNILHEVDLTFNGIDKTPLCVVAKKNPVSFKQSLLWGNLTCFDVYVGYNVSSGTSYSPFVSYIPNNVLKSILNREDALLEDLTSVGVTKDTLHKDIEIEIICINSRLSVVD